MPATPDPAMLVVAAALVDGEGRVCLQQRPRDKQHGGLWEFPGGKVEPGEHPADALCREIAEELGAVLNVADLEPCGFAASEAVVILLYMCRQWQGDVQCLEAEALAWFATSEIPALPMPPLDYPLAEQLAQVLLPGSPARFSRSRDLAIAKPDALS